MADLNKLELLDNYLSENSYLAGFQPSDADCIVFEIIGNYPWKKYSNINRWYNHIASFGLERKNFPHFNKSSDITFFDDKLFGTHISSEVI